MKRKNIKDLKIISLIKFLSSIKVETKKTPVEMKREAELLFTQE